MNTAWTTLEVDALLTSPTLLDDPYPVFHRLRREAPVAWSEAWGCWIVTRYDDVSAILQDHARFSSFGRVTNVIRRSLPAGELAQLQPLISHYSRGLINVDPPDHTRIRRLVQQTFLPRTLDRLKPHVQAIVKELLDDASANRQMDVVRDLAYPLPVTVIAELMGIPAEERDQFKRWSGQIVEFQATPRISADVVGRSQKALLELRAYFRDICVQRRAEPREDLISLLVQAEDAGDRLTEEELLSTCVSILIGGHETTTNLITTALWALLNHPEQMRALREDESLIGGAVEEFLRYEAPLQRLGRVAMQDVALRGQAVKQGQTVLLMLGAANRDPAQFPDPDRLDIRRQPNRHVAFGYGVHFCLGAGLARLEAPIAINTMLQRMPNLASQTSRLQWQPGVFRAPVALPVSF
ncbi:MAG: cytochrome P450 [Phycisphaeraceae bacterium]